MKLNEAIRNILDLGERAHFLIDLAKATTGREPSEKAPAYVKGIYGVLGLKDEREFEVLLHKLEKERSGGRLIIAGFLNWHYNNTKLSSKAARWWYGNAFRTFVTKMGSSSGHIEGKRTETVVSKDGDKTTTVVSDKELRGSGTNNALNFLVMMVDTIKQETNPEEGYIKLLEQFKAFGYPHIPDDIDYDKALVLVKNAYVSSIRDFQRQAVAAERDAEETKTKKRSLLGRLIRWI